jgi:hypothetical protein
MCRYSDKNLVKYEEAIVLNFDETGTIAWVTMKNYWEVFHSFSWATPNPRVKTITIGIPAGQLNSKECDSFAQHSLGTTYELTSVEVRRLRPCKVRFSISQFLDVFDVMKLQVELLKKCAYYSVGRTHWKGMRGFTHREVRPAISVETMSETIETALVGLGFGKLGAVWYPFTEIQPYIPIVRCDFRVQIVRRVEGMLRQDRGAKWICVQIREGKTTGLTAYFPDPVFIVEEQRTSLKGGALTDTGKTWNRDPRDIKPIFDFTRDMVPEKPIYDPVPAKLLVKAPPVESFSFQEFFNKLDDDRKKNEEEFISGTQRSVLRRDNFAKSSVYLHEHIKRVNCYGFRGDKRPPVQIQMTNGFLPGVTRKEKEYDEKGQMIKQSLMVQDSEGNWNYRNDGGAAYQKVMAELDVLTLGVFTADATFKGFVSTSTSTAIAKHFANEYAPEDHRFAPVFCYAMRCKQGFHLPTPAIREKGDTSMWNKRKDAENALVHNAEQEVAVAGGIGWDCIVGMRVIQPKPRGQFFAGPVFLCDELRKEFQAAQHRANPHGGPLPYHPVHVADNHAFDELFELFCGKCQGVAPGINWSYEGDKPPFDCSQDLWDRHHVAWESRAENQPPGKQ